MGRMSENWWPLLAKSSMIKQRQGFYSETVRVIWCFMYKHVVWVCCWINLSLTLLSFFLSFMLHPTASFCYLRKSLFCVQQFFVHFMKTPFSFHAHLSCSKVVVVVVGNFYGGSLRYNVATLKKGAVKCRWNIIETIAWFVINSTYWRYKQRFKLFSVRNFEIGTTRPLLVYFCFL